MHRSSLQISTKFDWRNAKILSNLTNHRINILLALLFSGLLSNKAFAQESTFVWPEGKQVAISLTFDDSRLSQIETGVALLDKSGVKATFYVIPETVEKNIKGWKNVVQKGHEIGNHTVRHPCTGNLKWSRNNALENYSIEQMTTELKEANLNIERILGVKPRAFAYPCGQTFVGRGVDAKSYIPVVAALFVTGRNKIGQGANDPLFCDFSNLVAWDSDNKDFDEILALIESAREGQQWIILAGHEIGDTGIQTTRISTLKALIKYASNPAHGVWMAPVGTIASYIEEQRKY